MYIITHAQGILHLFSPLPPHLVEVQTTVLPPKYHAECQYGITLDAPSSSYRKTCHFRNHDKIILVTLFTCVLRKVNYGAKKGLFQIYEIHPSKLAVLAALFSDVRPH